MAESMKAPFECLGVSLSESSGDNVSGDCPFCGKEDHFYVNQKTGQWDCKSCGKEGNLFTFLKMFTDMTHRETHNLDWIKLSKERSSSKCINNGQPVNPPIPIEAFKRWNMGWTGTEWLIPSYSEKGTVRDVRRWNGRKVRSTDGCSVQLGGALDLVASEESEIVWLCEGEWDAFALRWLLDLAGRNQEVVTWVPGAKTFKQEWVKLYKNKNVRIVFDADSSGDEGSMKIGRMLKDVAVDILYVCWPDTVPLGWDIRDFVLDGRGRAVTAEEAISILEGLLRPKHRRDRSADRTPLANKTRPQATADFNEVLEVFGKWAQLNQDFVDALAVSLAVCLANDVPGDPLWLYLVGQSGSGKTLILMSLQDSDRTAFYSTLSPKSLISGFNVHPDPSLLPQVDGKTAIFKDGTELLALHPDARREVYSVLRGAFDGHIHREFGNGVVRDFDLHFNLIIGVTPAIHGDNQATMGERFLKFELAEDLQESLLKIRAAVGNITAEIQMQSELQDVCRRFLLKSVDPHTMPRLSEEMITRVVSLAQLLGMLRAQVDREQFGDRDLKYRPSYEVGTRVAKQLVKLAMMLTYVFDVPDITETIYRVVERVAMNTVIGFHLDILNAIIERGNEGLSVKEISRHAHIPELTLLRRLQDLEQLTVLTRIRAMNGHAQPFAGIMPAMWVVTDHVLRLWQDAHLGESEPMNQAITGSTSVKDILKRTRAFQAFNRAAGRPTP